MARPFTPKEKAKALQPGVRNAGGWQPPGSADLLQPRAAETGQVVHTGTWAWAPSACWGRSRTPFTRVDLGPGVLPQRGPGALPGPALLSLIWGVLRRGATLCFQSRLHLSPIPGTLPLRALPVPIYVCMYTWAVQLSLRSLPCPSESELRTALRVPGPPACPPLGAEFSSSLRDPRAKARLHF